MIMKDLYGNIMNTLWKHYENSMNVLWKHYGNSMEAVWKHYEDSITIWKQYEDIMKTLWRQYEYIMKTLWKVKLAETSLRHGVKIVRGLSCVEFFALSNEMHIGPDYPTWVGISEKVEKTQKGQNSVF